jgi:hypothetical protein
MSIARIASSKGKGRHLRKMRIKSRIPLQTASCAAVAVHWLNAAIHPQKHFPTIQVAAGLFSEQRNIMAEFKISFEFYSP